MPAEHGLVPPPKDQNRILGPVQLPMPRFSPAIKTPDLRPASGIASFGTQDSEIPSRSLFDLFGPDPCTPSRMD